MHCFLPVAEGWAGEPRAASSRRVSSSSELDLPPGDHCEAGLLQLDVPLLRAQLRGSRLLDAMRMYRQGRASFALNFPFLELPLSLPLSQRGPWAERVLLPSCLQPALDLLSALVPPLWDVISFSSPVCSFLFLSTLLPLPSASPFHIPVFFIPLHCSPHMPCTRALSFPLHWFGWSPLPMAAGASWNHLLSGGTYLQEQAGAGLAPQ